MPKNNPWALELKKSGLNVRQKPHDEEHKIQCAIAQYLKFVENAHKDFTFFAVPNGGWRNPVVAAKLKAEGVRSGVSDLIILHAGKTYFVEIKTATGRQSDTQREFEQKVRALGFEYTIWRGLGDAINFVEKLKAGA